MIPDPSHHGCQITILLQCCIEPVGLQHIRIVRGKQLPVCRSAHIYRADLIKHLRNSVCQILIDVSLSTTVHVHIDDHDTIILQVLLYHGKKLHGRHLERYGNILISIHHDHVILFTDRIQICSSVIGCDFHILRQFKVLSGKLRDLLINLYPFNGRIVKIPLTLGSIGPGSVSKDQDIHSVLFLHTSHIRGSHGIIIIHTGQPFILQVHRLHAEQNIGRKHYFPVIFINLQIIINGLSLIGKIALPESKAVVMAKKAADQKYYNTNRHPPGPGKISSGTHKINNSQQQQNTCKDQECDRGSHCRDTDKGRYKGSDNASYGIGSIQLSNYASAVIQTVYRKLYQRRCYRSKQKQREYKDHHTCHKSGYNKEVTVYGKDQQC